MSTFSAQFIGAYRLATETGREGLINLRAGVESKRAYIMAQPGGPEGLEAVDCGFDCFEMGMSETDAQAWAEFIRANRGGGE